MTPPTSIQCVQRPLSPGITRRGVEKTNSLHLLPRVLNVSTITHTFVVSTGPTLPLSLPFYTNIYILYNKPGKYAFLEKHKFLY